MASPSEKLAKSLEKLKKLQDRGLVAIKASDLSRMHKERLQKNGFIREVINGWYILVPNSEVIGDTTSWYTSYWAFCSRYLQDRFGDDYYLSAEQSLQLHAGNTIVPKQLLVKSKNGNNLPSELLFGTSLFLMKANLPNMAKLQVVNDIRMFDLPSSIVFSIPSFYINQAIDARAALLRISDASELLGILLDQT